MRILQGGACAITPSMVVVYPESQWQSRGKCILQGGGCLCDQVDIEYPLL
jgi:hypothetical protein